jgi:hypothetical protein
MQPLKVKVGCGLRGKKELQELQEFRSCRMGQRHKNSCCRMAWVVS